LKLWETKTGRLLRTASGPKKLIAVSFAPDGATVAAAAELGVITLYDAYSLAVLQTIRYDRSERLRDMKFAPDGKSVAACDDSGTIRLWDPLTGQPLLSLEGHKARIDHIAFAPDGSSLASCSHDGEVRIWRSRLPQAR
jgi:WD40 repeat protein